MDNKAPKVLYSKIKTIETSSPIALPILLIQITFLKFPKPFSTETKKMETAYQGSAKDNALKTKSYSKSFPKIVWFQKTAKKYNIPLKNKATISKLIKTVEMNFCSCSLSFWISATYFTIPFWNPNVDTVSNEDMKFLRFPTNAIPPGPTKTASNLDVTKPIPIFRIILKLFKELILNNCDLYIFFKISKSVFI